MVLSAPPPDASQGAAEPDWLERITRVFRRTRRGVLILCDRANEARLPDLVRHLCRSGLPPEVLAAPGQLAEVPAGSIVVLAVRPEDATWLNLHRPVFSERSLRVVFFCSESTTTVLAQRAPDTYDWISHRVECPPGLPAHAIAGIRAALCARAPGIDWAGGESLEELFDVALPGRPLRRLSAQASEEEMAQAIHDAGRSWLVWTDLTGRRRLERVREALAACHHRTRTVLDHSAVTARDFWPVHDRLLPVDTAIQKLVLAGVRSPGRLGALAGLEPEAVELLAELVGNKALRPEEIEQGLTAAGDPGEWLAERWLAREAEKGGIESGSLRRISPVWRAAVKQGRRPWRAVASAALDLGGLPFTPVVDPAGAMWPIEAHVDEEGDPDEDPFVKSARIEAREHELRHAVLKAQAEGDPLAEAGARLAFGVYLTGRARWGEAEGAYREALRASKEAGAPQVEMRSLAQIGALSRQRGHHAEAEVAYREALAISQATGDHVGEAMQRMNLGMLAADKGLLREAEVAYRRAFADLQRHDEPLAAATALMLLAQLLLDSGRVGESKATFADALQRFESMGFQPGQAFSLRGLASALRLGGRSDEAIELCQRAIRIFEAHRDQLGKASALTALAHVLQEAGQLGQAAETCRAALRIHDELEQPSGRAHTLGLHGQILLAKDQLGEAEQAFEEALSIHQSLGDRQGQATALHHMGRLALARREPRAAFERFALALATHRVAENEVDAATDQVGLAEACLLAGRPLRATVWFAEALRKFDLFRADFNRPGALRWLAAAFAALDRPEVWRAALQLAREAATLLGPSRAPRIAEELALPSPTAEDLAQARETLTAAIAQAEAEFQASGDDLYAPLPE